MGKAVVKNLFCEFDDCKGKLAAHKINCKYKIRK